MIAWNNRDIAARISPDGVFVILFALCLPFKNSFCNVVVVAFAAFAVFRSIKARKFVYEFNSEKFYNFCFLPLLFLSLTVSLLYSSDKATGWHIIVRSVPLLFIPLFFSFVKLKKSDLNFALFGFVCANFITLFINLVRATWRSFRTTGEELHFDSSVSGGQEFWYSVVQGGNFYFSDELSYFLHPTYWAIFLAFSALIMIALFEHRNVQTLWAKAICLTALFFILVAIFLCSSRIVLAGTVLMLTVAIIMYLLRTKSFLLSIVGIITVAVFGALALNNPRTGGLTEITDQFRYKTRLQSWHAALEVAQDNLIIGAGVGDAEEALFTKYKQFSYSENLSLDLNEHNQYLQFLNFTGIIGLVVFIAGMVAALKTAAMSRNFTLFGFISLFAMLCLVECGLARQAGIIFYTFFYCLLIAFSRKTVSINGESINPVNGQAS